MRFFDIQAKADSKSADITIDKVIASDWDPDWVTDFWGDTSARMFIDAVEALGDLDNLYVFINSPGGDVSSGLRIMNYLKNHKAKVHITVTGMAASIASVILMAGDERHMAVGATIMTHDPAGWMGGFYTEADMRNRADALAVIKKGIVSAYMVGAGMTEEQALALMSDGDRYIDADEAVQLGLATSKDETLQAVACTDPQQFKQQLEISAQLKQAKQAADGLEKQVGSLTEQLETATAELDAFKNPQAASADEVIAACDKAGFDAMAVSMMKAKMPLAAVNQRLEMAAQINDLCKAQEIQPDQVLAKIDNPLQMMQVLVAEAKALVDQDLDHHHSPHAGSQKQPSAAAAYAQLNQTN